MLIILLGFALAVASAFTGLISYWIPSEDKKRWREKVLIVFASIFIAVVIVIVILIANNIC